MGRSAASVFHSLYSSSSFCNVQFGLVFSDMGLGAFFFLPLLCKNDNYINAPALTTKYPLGCVVNVITWMKGTKHLMLRKDNVNFGECRSVMSH